MPQTARRHFDEDILRARALLTEARRVPAARKTVAADMRRAAVAFAVGAMDAYLCDAHVDCLTRCLRAYREGRCSRLRCDDVVDLDDDAADPVAVVIMGLVHVRHALPAHGVARYRRRFAFAQGCPARVRVSPKAKHAPA